MRFSLIVPLTLVFTACTGRPGDADSASAGTGLDTTDSGDETGPSTPTESSSSQADTGDTGTSSDSTTDTGSESEDQGGGWSIRDNVPYGRSGHAAILDEQGDRMIVFGGAGNDTWELPLSGPHANVWSELVVKGEHPPVHSYGSSTFADSAVYDPAGQRMLVLLNPTPVTATENPVVELWELSLSGTPKWKRLVTAGPDPGVEVQSGRVVLDRDANRLFIVGGALEKTGVWTLSLADTPTWSRFADTPAGDLGQFYVGHTLLFDAERGQLVLFGGYPDVQRIWGLSLATGEWTLIDEGDLASGSSGAAALDAEHDRIVIFGADQNPPVRLFSLTEHAWGDAKASADAWSLGSAGAVDAQRGRILYFSGFTGKQGGGLEVANTTWTFSLDDLVLTELLPATRHSDLALGERTAVWDPVRGAVVAFGGSVIGETSLHGITAVDGWSTASVGTTPTLTGMAAIYDPIDQAILAFGGRVSKDSNALMRLSSSPGAAWETLAVDGAPTARAGAAAIYDPDNHRMIVDGGQSSGGKEPTPLGDTWTLSLAGPPVWTQLTPSGDPPERYGHVAIHDPEGQRMIFYGGNTGWGDKTIDLWSLSLTGEPTWTRLKEAGKNPGPIIGGSAVYDPDGHRMIVVDVASSLTSRPARVLALELDDETPTWHRFCTPGLNLSDVYGDATEVGAVLVDDGLFVSISGGAFRFDLQTDYCD